jgi:glutamate-1-semialdehyde aminotransferase
MTGRQTVLLFDGKYHGEGDATLVVTQDGEVVPESRGLPPWITAQARVVAFNDAAAVRSRSHGATWHSCWPSRR